MATPAEYVKTNGQKALRKRRRDSRCLVAGVCSWPVEMAHLRHLARNDKAAYDRERQRMFDWMKRTQH